MGFSAAGTADITCDNKNFTSVGNMNIGTNTLNFWDIDASDNIICATNKGIDTDASGTLKIGDVNAQTIDVGRTAARAVNISTGSTAATIVVGNH